MWEFLVKGGPVMIPIGICSIIALALFLERIWVLRRKAVMPAKFLMEVQQLIARGKLDEAKQLCFGHKVLIASVIGAGLENRGETGALSFHQAIEEGGRRAVAQLFKHLNALSTIATISPLLGLLGTVSGMIKIFHSLSLSNVNAAPLAGGISEALITTEAGLVVAIPTWVIYRYCMSRAQALTHEMEIFSGEIVDLVGDRTASKIDTTGKTERAGRPQFEGAR